MKIDKKLVAQIQQLIKEESELSSQLSKKRREKVRLLREYWDKKYGVRPKAIVYKSWDDTPIKVELVLYDMLSAEHGRPQIDGRLKLKNGTWGKRVQSFRSLDWYAKDGGEKRPEWVERTKNPEPLTSDML